MRQFAKVNPQLWGKKTFKSMSQEAKLALLYFLSSPHQTSAGCCRLPDAYASSDLGWHIDVYVKARKEVEAAEFIVFDEDEEELYVRGWFQDNPTTNEKHKHGCLRIIGSLNSEKIYTIAEEEICSLCA